MLDIIAAAWAMFSDFVIAVEDMNEEQPYGELELTEAFYQWSDGATEWDGGKGKILLPGDSGCTS